MKNRFKRVLTESGGIGAALRLAMRLPRQLGDRITALPDFLLRRLPMSVFTNARDSDRLSKNAELAGKHKGERCFILATGPSLREQDISGLEGETIITVNQGFYFARERGLSPTYHCMVDDLFLETRFDGLHRELAQSLDEWDANLLTTIDLGDHWMGLGLESGTFGVRQVLNSRPWDEADIPVSVDPTMAVPGFVSVVHAAISWAIYMGFKEIYLLGCDMDYFISPQQTYMRCYEDDRYLSNKEATADLFSRDQIGLIEWILVEFRAFANLGKTAQIHGSQIVNAGEGGALNVYPRSELRTVLGTPECLTPPGTEPH